MVALWDKDDDEDDEDELDLEVEMVPASEFKGTAFFAGRKIRARTTLPQELSFQVPEDAEPGAVIWYVISGRRALPLNTNRHVSKSRSQNSNIYSRR